MELWKIDAYINWLVWGDEIDDKTFIALAFMFHKAYKQGDVGKFFFWGEELSHHYNSWFYDDYPKEIVNHARKVFRAMCNTLCAYCGNIIKNSKDDICDDCTCDIHDFRPPPVNYEDEGDEN